MEGNKGRTEDSRGSGRLSHRGVVGESGVALAMGREPGWRGGGVERKTTDNARFQKRKPGRVEVKTQVER